MYFLKSSSGRNNQGRITVRHKGGRHKRLYRPINTINQSGKIVSFHYDPFRSAKIALCTNGQYILPGVENKIGSTVTIKPISQTLIGEQIFNISLYPGKSGILTRSTGTHSIVLKQNTDGTTLIRLPSKQLKLINSSNICTSGVVADRYHSFPRLKAGRNRWKGIRPTVKGRAMNAMDHPNGGKTAGGGQPKTPWGKLAKWVKTVKKSKRTLIGK